MQHNTSKKRKTSSSAAAAAARVAAPARDTPLSLYKQATRLVRQQQQCGADTSADSDIEAKLLRALQLLSESQAAPATVTHSLDLELADEPQYLAASAHLQLGTLYQRQDRLDAAAQQYRSSLEAFPRFVAALSALGQVLKAAAASPAALQEAEQLLQQAVDVAQRLSQEEGGLLVESNKGCAAELEAADGARAALAMLQCQAGRSADAAPHLRALGFKYRLAQNVLHYRITQQQQQQQQEQSTEQASHQPDPSSGSSIAPCSFMQAVDGALPDTLLHHLQQVFRPGADFWRAHAYGRVGYFSYFFQLEQQAAPSSSMHQLAHYLQQLGSRFFPDLQEAKYAEFWAHCRRHSSGHQLHFDSDDEGQGGVRHPIITAIVFLSDNTHPAQATCTCAGAAADSAEQQPQPPPGSCSCSQQPWIGGPTLITDQVLGGPLATQGWLAYPATNRVAFMDGRYLHGVIPGRRPTPSEEGRRCTLMVAFWRDLKCRTPPGSGVGACMHMPDPTAAAAASGGASGASARTAGHTWVSELKPLPAEALDAASQAVVVVPGLQHVSEVWQSVEAGASTSGAAYEFCFQGF